MDVFIEYMVSKRRSAKTFLFKILLVLAALFLEASVLFFFGFIGGFFSIIGIMFSIAILFLACHLIISMDVEFEYSFTNGEMDVDKIIAKRRRSRLLTVKCGELEDFGRYKEYEHKNKAYGRKVFACDSPSGDGLWYCVGHQNGKGPTLLVFNANDRLLEGMKPFLPRQLSRRAFEEGR